MGILHQFYCTEKENWNQINKDVYTKILLCKNENDNPFEYNDNP